MKTEKVKRLEKAGWELSGAKDFLGLNASEAELIEIKLELARQFRERARNGHAGRREDKDAEV
jgi:hypothetical protein